MTTDMYLGPVYWRIVRRGAKQLYISTFECSWNQIVKGWGPEGLAYCDRATGKAVARIETHLSQAARSAVITVRVKPPVEQDPAETQKTEAEHSRH